MASSSNEKCVLCNEEFTTTPTVVQMKGFQTMLHISKERGYSDFAEHLQKMVDNGQTILVHFDCRRKFTDTRNKSHLKLSAKKLRSSTDNSFNWKEHCFFCEKQADFKHYKRESVNKVMTLPLRESLIACAIERDDEWGNEVLGRLGTCNDLVAEEAVYHSVCMTKFRLKRKSEKQRGKPVDNILSDSFIRVCEWLEKEGDCELHTIKEIQENKVKLTHLRT